MLCELARGGLEVRMLCFEWIGHVFGGMVNPMNQSASAYLLFFVGVDN